MTAAAALPAAIRRLRAAGVPEAAGDARKLLAHALQIAPDRLTLHLNDPMTPAARARFDQGLAARTRRQPLSQIIGHRLFWGRRFQVTSDVLDPRPETEILIAAALTAPFERVLDLGTGTGCIVLTLLAERQSATGLGVDISPAALAVAQTNAQAHDLTARLTLHLSDWLGAVTGQYDLILSNPPYISAPEFAGLAPEVRHWEPRIALTPGGDGLAAYRIIAAQAPAHLAPGGRLLAETGPAQAAAVAALWQAAGLTDVAILPDLDGRPRVVCGRLPPILSF